MKEAGCHVREQRGGKEGANQWQLGKEMRGVRGSCPFIEVGEEHSSGKWTHCYWLCFYPQVKVNLLQDDFNDLANLTSHWSLTRTHGCRQTGLVLGALQLLGTDVFVQSIILSPSLQNSILLSFNLRWALQQSSLTFLSYKDLHLWTHTTPMPISYIALLHAGLDSPMWLSHSMAQIII